MSSESESNNGNDIYYEYDKSSSSDESEPDGQDPTPANPDDDTQTEPANPDDDTQTEPANPDDDTQTEPANPDDDTQVGKKTSDIWQHFDSEENHSICKYCKKTYAKSTSTTILRRHYEKHHERRINKAKQTTLQFSTTLTPHPNEIMHEKTGSIVEWIVLDLQPFSVVESESFIRLINKLDPHYRLPSRHTIKRLIIDEFEERRKVIINFFQNSTSKFSLTCDIWSSVKMESFMALTIHYIDSK